MSKYILIVDYDCLPSLTAINWAKSVDTPIEICSSPLVHEFYGGGAMPKLIAVDEYGLISDVCEGYSKSEYERIVGKWNSMVKE